jgi:hypothetical protein
VTRIHLGTVAPSNVRVQAYFGPVHNNRITSATALDLAFEQSLDHGESLFGGIVPATESGSYGLNIRVIPTHPHLTQEHELRLITWAR